MKPSPHASTLEQIRQRVSSIVAIDLSTEEGHLRALELVRSLFAGVTRRGLVVTHRGLVAELERSQDGRLVLGLREQLEARK